MLSINMDDVLSVLNSCRPYLIFFGVVLALAVIALIYAGVAKKVKKPAKSLIRAQAGIAALLALVVTVNLICFGPMSTMISLATGNGTISDESVTDANALGAKIGEEGMVLLENDDAALPLSEGTSLNVFGWSSTAPVYGGAGSGALSDAYPTISLLDSLTNAGFALNTELSDFYTSYASARPDVGMWAQDWTLPEPAVSTYTDDMLANAKSFSDTALFVVSRPGGENADLPTDMPAVVDGSWAAPGTTYVNGTYDDTLNAGNDWDAGDTYLELSNREEELLDLVCSNFGKVIVVVNAANTMQLDWLDKYDSIKSTIWAASPGQTGFEALGKILNGTVNPSGKTVDTFVSDLKNTPVFNNIGYFVYDNMDEFNYTSTSWLTGGEVTTTPTFVNYVEGIYVGYRYYETAYAEAQTAETAAGAHAFDYDAEVLYPFGYGLSYTTFTQKMGPISESDGTITFDVTVTNDGAVAGKDVVQVYYNPPYTNGGIEKSAVNLIEFGKTSLLEPGASETITISFNAEDMASYDSKGAGCYVLEKGDYLISIRSDAHNAIDEQTYTVDATISYDESNPRSTDDTAAVNQFADVEGEITYLSRADGFANYDEVTAAPSTYSMGDAYKATFIENSNYDPNDYNDATDEMPTTGAKNGLVLADLRGVDYDDPQWDTLLDQLTVEDMDTMIARGGYSTAAAESVGKIGTTDCDGPASINNNFTGTSSIGFPACTMIAATWNRELAQDFGRMIGKMADEMNVSGWYAPAMNNHRSAFAGRNFEYFSEDGTLAGEMAAKAVEGAAEYGVYAYIKHYALNDQEINRNDMLCTWASEQSIREIYLKPFEICTKVGNAMAVMSSFNYIGTQWAGADYGLQTQVLRNEWGFRGFVLTDYYGVYAYMDADQAIRGGTDICLSPMDNATNHLTDTTSATSIKAARQACKNLMYTVVNSRAYAPENLNTGLENWKIIAIVVDVLLGALVLMLEVLSIKKFLKKSVKPANK